MWVPSYLSCMEYSWWNMLFSRSTRNIEVRFPWLGGGRILGNRQIRNSKGIERTVLSRYSTQNSLVVSTTLRDLPSRSSGTPNTPSVKPTTLPSLSLASCVYLCMWSMKESSSKPGGSTHRKWAIQSIGGWENKNLSYNATLWKIK